MSEPLPRPQIVFDHFSVYLISAHSFDRYVWVQCSKYFTLTQVRVVREVRFHGAEEPFLGKGLFHIIYRQNYLLV